MKSGYKYGLQSMLRERMVIDMVADELESEAIASASLATATLLSSHCAGRGMKSLYDSIMHKMSYASEKAEYAPVSIRSQQEEAVSVVQEAKKIFAALAKSGVLAEFDKKSMDIYNRYKEQESKQE